jgi:hypothetical protein
MAEPLSVDLRRRVVDAVKGGMSRRRSSQVTGRSSAARHLGARANLPMTQLATAQSEWQQADHLIKDAHVVFGCVDG